MLHIYVWVYMIYVSNVTKDAPHQYSRRPGLGSQRCAEPLGHGGGILENSYQKDIPCMENM